jgi:hypothetical protein
MDTESQSYREREDMWDEAWPASTSHQHPDQEPDIHDEEEPFPGVVGTSDPLAAARDSEPYTPPVDPPVLPGGRDGIDVATGFGFSPEEEAAADPSPRGDEDVLDEVLLTLRQDSITSTYNLEADVDRGVVTIRGEIGSLEEIDHATAVVSGLPGVVEVVDETTLSPA